MYWRPIREADLSTCLEIQPACFGDALTGRDGAMRVWRNLLHHPAFQGSVYETERPIGGHTIVGCAMGVFVDPTFADRELANPLPGLNSRIVDSIASRHSVLLDRHAIASGNANAGLDFVNLYGTWRDGILDADQLVEVQTLLGASFLDSLAGYRFNRVVKEAAGQPGIALAHATGSYRLVAEFPEHDSALFVASPDSARAAPFSVAARVYRYQPPVLRLRQAEQTLLSAALNGNTDAALGTQLGISVEAVKKRWMSIFARVEQFKPEILTDNDIHAGKNPDNSHRGPQKRHRVVAYVRTHPEELRPYCWNAAER